MLFNDLTMRPTSVWRSRRNWFVVLLLALVAVSGVELYTLYRSPVRPAAPPDVCGLVTSDSLKTAVGPTATIVKTERTAGANWQSSICEWNSSDARLRVKLLSVGRNDGLSAAAYIDRRMIPSEVYGDWTEVDIADGGILLVERDDSSTIIYAWIRSGKYMVYAVLTAPGVAGNRVEAEMRHVLGELASTL